VQSKPTIAATSWASRACPFVISALIAAPSVFFALSIARPLFLAARTKKKMKWKVSR